MKHRPILLTLFVLLFLCLVGVLVGAAPARASTTITVSTTSDELNDDGQCSLREAIRAANLDTASGATPGECPAGSGADTIEFAPNVTSTITISPISPVLPTITDTLSIVGSKTITLAVYLARTGYVFTFDGSGKVFSLSGLTITGLGSSSGGISMGSGSLTVDSARINENKGSGGLFISPGGVVTVTNSTIANNNASSGGGIQNLGTLTLKNSTISGNATGFSGGGIYSTSYAEIINSTISGNSGGGFGGSGGGGIYNSGAFILVNSTVSGNQAPSNPNPSNSGGGIFNSGTLTITTSTIVSNTTSGLGGGLRAASGAALLRNTIIANSTAGNDCSLGSGTVTDGGFNIVEDNTCSFTGGTDPLLGSLQNNGGPTWTHALLPGSPAIDAGDNATCTATDQRGAVRPFDGDGNGNAVCDIGAYEYGAVIPNAWLYLPLVMRGP